VVGDPDKGGWMTVGFSLKSGSQFSYLALEGDADFARANSASTCGWPAGRSSSGRFIERLKIQT